MQMLPKSWQIEIVSARVLAFYSSEYFMSILCILFCYLHSYLCCICIQTFSTFVVMSNVTSLMWWCCRNSSFGRSTLVIIHLVPCWMVVPSSQRKLSQEPTRITPSYFSGDSLWTPFFMSESKDPSDFPLNWHLAKDGVERWLCKAVGLPHHGRIMWVSTEKNNCVEEGFFRQKKRGNS